MKNQTDSKESVIKKLECLFAWNEFYRVNQQWDGYAKSEIQIINFKKKHNLQ